MRINGMDTSITPNAYYFLIMKQSFVDISNVSIELTDINGDTITDRVSLTPGECTDGTSQFKPSSQPSIEYIDC